MRRDLDLVRAFLLALEAADDAVGSPPLAGYAHQLVEYHARLLLDAGLIAQMESSAGPRGYRLTWAGHEFLDAARPAQRWLQAKGLIESAGGVAFHVLQGVLTELAKRQVGLD